MVSSRNWNTPTGANTSTMNRDRTHTVHWHAIGYEAEKPASHSEEWL
jgi:hypothetical protein